MAAGTFSIDRCPHSKQRIFLSIDVTDSTKIKSSSSQPEYTSNEWAKTFLSFLHRIDVVYKKKLVDIVNKYCPIIDCQKCTPKSTVESPSQTVKTWKYIGDEVVLMADLVCDIYQASLHVLSLAETIKDFNNDPDNTLRIKGTAWVAGFPVDNIEHNLSISENHKVEDFLGPLIDLGFRLSKFATEDRLIISASLALFITREPKMEAPIEYMNERKYRFPLCFGGFVEVKGVKDGKHPLIWYPVKETEESELCIVEHNKLEKFLIGKEVPFKNWPYAQFIPGTCEFDLHYIEQYDKVIKEQKKYPHSIYFKEK